MAYSNEEMLLAIRGNDMNSRNKALKQLYLDPVVNAKVQELLNFSGTHRVDLDEVIQEAIILLDDLIRNGKFQSNSTIRTFLIGICKNLIRSSGKKIDRITIAIEPTELTNYDQSIESPEELVILEEQGEAEQQRDKLLRQLMNQVTEKCKQVLQLYYFQSQSMAQIATQQGLKNADQAKKAAKRCRRQLKNKLQAEPKLALFLKKSL